MEPKVATRMDDRLKPVTPGPPKILLTINPPRRAPTMPMTMVMIIPPGSGPGMAILASIPAISPTTIQATIPTLLSPPPCHLVLHTVQQYSPAARCALSRASTPPSCAVNALGKARKRPGASGFAVFRRPEGLRQETLQRRRHEVQREENRDGVEQGVYLA